jgi:hypothetical protein
MRSGCSATSSFANRCIKSASAAAQRASIRMLRPSVHPSFWSPPLERRDIGLSFPVALSIPHQHANAPHPLALLRARRERPRGRAAEKHDELAAVHSITSPAAACNVRDRARLVGEEPNHRYRRSLRVGREQLDAVSTDRALDAATDCGPAPFASDLLVSSICRPGEPILL